MEATATTREKIIYHALKLFAAKGYDGVSMREIAAAVGIQGASLYNHFKGKEDIFNAIFTEMTKQYDAAAIMLQVPIEDAVPAAEQYHNISEEQLFETGKGLFSFFTQNEFAVLFRKLLVSEQHKFPLAGQRFQQYYLDGPIQFQSAVFFALQQTGDLVECDAETMALHFYSPIYYLLSKFDLGCPYDDCIEQLKKHVHLFCTLYRK